MIGLTPFQISASEEELIQFYHTSFKSAFKRMSEEGIPRVNEVSKLYDMVPRNRMTTFFPELQRSVYQRVRRTIQRETPVRGHTMTSHLYVAELILMKEEHFAIIK